MGLSCKSRSAIAVCNSTQDVGQRNNNNGNFLESFKFRELEAATNRFSRENLILKTSHGHMYRGILPDGRVVAVKRPDTHDDAAAELAFTNEVQILSKLFSRRLVNLLGCSRDHGRVKLLVLEYMENGPLHENLTEPVVSLSWPMRVKLAVDIAKAIRALHASSPPIVHRNIRTTNVFLDRDGNARLGDFCLAKIMPETSPPRRSSVLISIPEIAIRDDNARHSSVGLDDFDVDETSSSSTSDSRINPKTDVFSFGILLLEIMSGRSALTDHGGDHHHRLLDWALPLIKHGHSMEICDARSKPFPDSAAVRIMANLAARCVRSSSSRRPQMEEVVQCLTRASKLVPEPLWIGTTSSISSTTPASYPEFGPELLTTSTTTSRELSSHITTRRSVSHRKEKLINSNLDAGHTPFNGARSSSSSSALWTGFSSGFPNLRKKRTLVFRLGRFLVRKLRIGATRRGSGYDKLSNNNPVTETARKKKSGYLKSAARSPLKGAKVSDDLEGEREISVVEVDREDLQFENKPEKKSRNSSRLAGYYSSGNHRSGKKFVRL